MQPLDFSTSDLIDAHSHALPVNAILGNGTPGFVSRSTIMGMCAKSAGISGPDMDRFIDDLAETTPFAAALTRRLAEFLGVAPTRSAVEVERSRRLTEAPESYFRALMDDAHITGLIVDDGYPLPRVAPETIAREYARPVGSVVRIEPLITEIAQGTASWKMARARLVECLELAVDKGAIALKSIIAYRTGLDIRPKDEGRDLSDAYGAWRDNGLKDARSTTKELRDALINDALDVAERHDLPFHIHCGGGDADILFEHARPQCLFPLLKSRAGQDVVLIHAGWPWTDEAAFLASILPRVYLETSLATPWASLALDHKLATLIGIAPPGKIMYGSDASSEPEILWFAAKEMRRALTRVLGGAVAQDWLSETEAQRIGRNMLADNARRLHRLTF